MGTIRVIADGKMGRNILPGNHSIITGGIIFSNRADTPEPEPVELIPHLHYTYAEGSGAATADQSPNEFDGTLRNMDAGDWVSWEETPANVSEDFGSYAEDYDMTTADWTWTQYGGNTGTFLVTAGGAGEVDSDGWAGGFIYDVAGSDTWDDYDVDVDVSSYVGTRIVIGFRIGAAAGYWLFCRPVSPESTVYKGGRDFITGLTSVNAAASPPASVTSVKITVRGPQIKVYYNGSATPTHDFTDATYSAGTIGLSGYAGGVVYDNLVVTHVEKASCGTAVYFGGTDEDILVDHATAGDFEWNEPFSVSFWIKFTSADLMGVISKLAAGPEYTGWYVYTGSGVIAFQVNADVGSSEYVGVYCPAINDGNWWHVGISYDGSGDAAGIKFYLYGVPAATATLSDTFTDVTIKNATELTVGSQGGAGAYFTGALCNTRIYSGVLTDTQFTALAAQNEPVEE